MVRFFQSFISIFFSYFILHLIAVIFPTLWEYLKSLGIKEGQVYFLGICIAAVTVSDMFVGLFIGRLLDKLNRYIMYYVHNHLTKHRLVITQSTFGYFRILPLVLILNFFQIVGSILYFVGASPTLLLVARLIQGLGNVRKDQHVLIHL